MYCFSIPTTSLALPTRRWFSEKRRRRRIAFHQRQMRREKDRIVPNNSETKPMEDVTPSPEEKTEDTATTAPPVIQTTVDEALPAASVSHKVNCFLL